MSLIVEDGTGLATANSYVTVAEADTYFLASGTSTWVCPESATEIVRLDLTVGADADGDVTITLNGVAFTVAVTIGNTTHVCGEIRAATYAGWTTSGVDGYVVFTADSAGCRDGAYTFDAGTTGAVGSFTETQTGSDAAKEQALIRAARALDGIYASQWPGAKLVSTQALGWPRSYAEDVDGFYIDGVPQAVKNAQCEAALIELLAAGSLSPSYDRGGAIIREKVGPLETEYANNAPAGTTYNTISQALASIIGLGGSLVLRRG